MNTDNAFYMGTTHEICQDYTLSNSNSIAISDGCSGSNNSDIGSRVLSIIAMNKITELDSLYSFEEKECILLARPAIKMLGIPNECLDATLLLATSYKNSLEAICCGDGVIAIKTKDNDIFIINCAYTDSYPFFMNYLYGRNGRLKEWDTNHNKREVSLTLIKEDGSIIEIGKNLSSISRISDFGILKILDNKIFIEIVDSDIIEHISIMSDGVHSFYETIKTNTSKYNKSISYLEVIKELLVFKIYNETFVKRRVNKFKKDCLKKNWGNADDVSLATIYVGKKL